MRVLSLGSRQEVGVIGHLRKAVIQDRRSVATVLSRYQSDVVDFSEIEKGLEKFRRTLGRVKRSMAEDDVF